MHLDRAQQILRSSETVHVTYDGKPVWIEAVNPTDLTAQITMPVHSGHRFDVPVDELIERMPQS